jgi:hypothetical protein
MMKLTPELVQFSSSVNAGRAPESNGARFALAGAPDVSTTEFGCPL